MNKAAARELLRQFDFKALFLNELGWDDHTGPLPSQDGRGDRFTLVDITARARQAFDVDRVTKRFYDRFKTEHAAFLKQIEGIDDEHECEWYASIMLKWHLDDRKESIRAIRPPLQIAGGMVGSPPVF
jgi:hypothetical protein